MRLARAAGKWAGRASMERRFARRWSWACGVWVAGVWVAGVWVADSTAMGMAKATGIDTLPGTAWQQQRERRGRALIRAAWVRLYSTPFTLLSGDP